MEPKYLVIEIQRFPDGSMSTPAYAYDTQNAAEAKYHTILASAANSSLAKHSAIMISDDGFPMKHECYTHITTEETNE